MPRRPKAFADACLALFVLRPRRNLKRSEIVELIVDAAPNIERFMAGHPPPFIAGIYAGGRIELLKEL
jgi:hypothetical protein